MSSKATTDNITAIDSKKPTTKQELIAANIKLLIEQLEAGHSDALTNYLTAMSRFHTDSIITEGSDVGTIHKVCANPSCPVHHPKQQAGRDDAKWKAEQEKQRKEQAIANTTGLRVLSAIGAAVPVRLLKRDLLFILERLVSVMDEPRVETLARQHGIRQKRDDGGIQKAFIAYLRRADESTLSRALVESSILLAATRGNPSVILKDAATAYKVDTDASTAKVNQEFATKDKAKKAA